MNLDFINSIVKATHASHSVVTINPHTLKLHRICSSLPFQLVCVAEIKASLLPRIVGVLFIFPLWIRTSMSISTVSVGPLGLT